MQTDFLQIDASDITVPDEMAAQMTERQRFIFDKVAAHHPVFQHDLEEVSGINRKAVTRAVKELNAMGAIQIRASLKDLRKRYFIVHQDLINADKLEALRTQAAAAHNGLLLSLAPSNQKF